ncbi:hypothetical protein JW960_26650 [candidate division KSB1 bacterium]|nr:hypothetical protein [candidate division KSB1 bacterium]
MPSLQVRELPAEIYQKLKQEAELEHRTLSQQAIITLAKGLNVPLQPIKRRRKILMQIKQNAHELGQYQLSDPVKLLREDRD